MTRLPDWPTRLAEHMASVKDLPFAWVSNDCCTFAAAAVIAITGTDLMAPLRGRYAGKPGAVRLIARAGGLQALVSQYLGEPLPRHEMAGRGDVMLFPMAEPYGPHALGVCVGAYVAAPGPEGRVLLPLAAATAAWRV